MLSQVVVDQMGRSVHVPMAPQRIVSLVPSQTELLVDLGLVDRLVGVTDFCTEPAAALEGIARVGGTKRFSMERIEALAPDLIIGNLEENYEQGIRALESRYPVWMSDVYSLADNSAMLRAVGALTGTVERAEQMALAIEHAFDELPVERIGTAAYLIWRKPWMAAARKTFIDAMLSHAGFVNVFADRERYPEISLEEIVRSQPDFVLLSSEPFPFAQEHIREVTEAVPSTQVLIVDAMPFSWYGSRMRTAPAYFQALREQLDD